MNHDFSKPQRQSAIGIVIMAANTLQHVVRALIIPIVIAIAKLDKVFLSYVGIGVAVILVIVLVFAYFSYLKFTFFLDHQKQEFVINKGIFNRTQLTVQLDKIQQVNINQNILQKIIGVYGLKIDTPGTEDQEVSIKAISEQVANSLKVHLLGKNAEAMEILDPERLKAQDIPILKVSTTTLLKVGLTSNYGRSIGLLIASMFPLYHNAREIFYALQMDEEQVDEAFKAALGFFSVGILLVLILFALLMINLFRTLIRFFDLHISKHQHALLISSGLFARKNTLLSPNKVQITSYTQNYFQRKMNLLNVELKQAASGHAQDPEELKSSNLEIPGCNASERDQLIAMIFGSVPPQSASFYPDWRYLNLPIFFKVFLPNLIFLICWFNLPQLHPYYPVAVVYTIFAVAVIYFGYRRHRLNVDQNFIVKRSGVWDVKREIILPHKIQAIKTFQYPWHKGVDVGHVDLHTAAGIIHFRYGNYTQIKKMVNYWLYQIESGSEEWM